MLADGVARCCVSKLELEPVPVRPGRALCGTVDSEVVLKARRRSLNTRPGLGSTM